MIQCTDYRIDSATPGYQILVRNKRLVAVDTPARGVVLFVHGATYGSTHTFDYAIDGESWMDSMANQGFDVFCLDLLGYGLSDRPAVMREPPENNAPIVDTRHAVAEVDRAINFILELRKIARLDLIGYSWGTVISGSWAGQHADKIRRLVLAGALWVQQGRVPASGMTALGAYRKVDVKAAMTRWATGLTQAEIDTIVPPARVQQWCEDIIRSDPEAMASDPAQLKAPTGVIKDFMHCSATGEDWYKPEQITAPTQIVVGAWDKETTPAQCQAVFERLTRAPLKRLTIIGAGTHSLLLENHRHELHAVVAGFLCEPEITGH